MADFLTVSERSLLMGKIRGKDTRPELLVRRYLHGQGFRYRLHSKNLPGRPDIVLPKYRTVVEVRGCFWHQHGAGCSIGTGMPRTNTSFWTPKLERNKERDLSTQKELQAAGWRVLVIWECELKRATRGAALYKLTSAILEAELSLEVECVEYYDSF